MSGYSYRRPSRLLTGASLTEVLLALTISLAVAGGAAKIALSSAQMGKVIDTKAAAQIQAKKGWDWMLQDIQVSSGILSSSNGKTSDTSTTLILRAPAYDSSFAPVVNGSGSAVNDTILYYLSGTAAPYTLHRQVIAASSSSRTNSDTVIASGITSLRLTYLATLSTIGNGTMKTFPLADPPTSTTLGGLDNSPSVTVAGTSLTSGVTFTASGSSGSATLSTAPATSAAVDIQYPVSPSTTTATIIAITPTLTLSSSDPSLPTASAQSLPLTLTGTAYLRNHL